MRKLFICLVMLAMLAAFGFAVACDDEPSDEEARAALCADLEQLDLAVDTFLELNAQSTIGEIKAARTNLTEAVDAVESSASDVPDAEMTDLQQAYHTVNETIQEMEDDQTAQEVVDAIAISVQNLAAAHQQLFADLGCAGATPTESATVVPTEESTAEATVPAETPVPTEDADATETLVPVETTEPTSGEPTEVQPTSEGP